MDSEVLFRYRGHSRITDRSIEFATTAEDAIFDGDAEMPAVAARALLCVAEVAATRFFVPGNMIAARILAADPVVTCEPDRLRFESFSQCCGVHARLDLLPDGLSARVMRSGTTNVDFGPDTCAALANVTTRDPLRLTVGANRVELETMTASVTERQVPLPERWVRGFGEVQVALTDPAPVLRMEPAIAQRFLRALPRGRAGQMTSWTQRAGASITLISRPTAASVCVAAPARLRVLEPLSRQASSLTAYTNPTSTEPTSVAWVLEIPGGRLTLTLSPDWQRGFSGEGGLLLDLASLSAAADALTLRQGLTDRVRFSKADACQCTRLSAARTRSALTWLGMHGQIGYDAAEDAFFWRHLPYPDDLLAADPPRLRDAHTLVQQGAVHATADGRFSVSSSGHEYKATVDRAGFTCTCPWVAKHGTSRGPCKHVLACVIDSQNIRALSHPDQPQLSDATSAA